MKFSNRAWCVESGFANRIRQARENAGLTRFRVATIVGTCQEYIYKMECGESVPNIKRVAELADLYGVSIDYLCKGGGPMIRRITASVIVDGFKVYRDCQNDEEASLWIRFMTAQYLGRVASPTITHTAISEIFKSPMEVMA